MPAVGSSVVSQVFKFTAHCGSLGFEGEEGGVDIVDRYAERISNQPGGRRSQSFEAATHDLNQCILA